MSGGELELGAKSSAGGGTNMVYFSSPPEDSALARARM